MTADHVPRWVWVPQLIAAGILVMAGVLKLTGGETDIYIFTALEMEPTGRILIGIIEVIGAGLLVSSFAAVGAILAMGLMMGALMAHATRIGFIVLDDGGAHVALLVLVVVCALAVGFLRRRELPLIGDTL